MEWCCHGSEAFAVLLQCSSEVRLHHRNGCFYSETKKTYLKKGSGLRCVL